MNQLLNLVTKKLQLATHYALSIQKKDGHWLGPLDSNSTMEAEFLMLIYYLEIDAPQKRQYLINHILSQQQDDGAWALYFEGPGDLSTTVECYFALLLSGMNKTDHRLEKAKLFILKSGGLSNVRMFTRIWLALFGQWSWKSIPIIPPELILLPTWFPINIYAFASWARATIVPLSLVMMKRPEKAIPKDCYLDDLHLDGQNNDSLFLLTISKVLNFYHCFRWKPGRKKAVKKTLDWILAHQEADGSWGGIQPPWVYSLIALYTMDYSINHPALQRGLQGFDTFSIYSKDSLQIQACISPVWDTGLMINALTAAGFACSHPQLALAYTWLLKKQIFVGGDWQITQPKLLPGGFAFEFENNHYPDVDDTAEVLIALWHANQHSPSDSYDLAIERATQWILGMQCKQGGWAAFDKDNNTSFLAKFPFFDFGEVLDPPSVDVTAHVLEALGLMGYSFQHPVIKKAVKYIYQEQEQDGSWFGRWGVNYIYGTAGVLCALLKVGEDMTQSRIHQAVQFLLHHQQADGSWGESCASYVDQSLRGQGPSTPSQTAWALLGLMAAGYHEHGAVEAGIEYLCRTMNSAGTWDEPYYTGCGFPGYGDGKRKIQQIKNARTLTSAGFMINYHLYRHCWPLMARGYYQQFWNDKLLSEAKKKHATLERMSAENATLIQA